MADERPSRQSQGSGSSRSITPSSKRSGRTTANHLLNFQSTYASSSSPVATARTIHASTSRRRVASARPQVYDRSKFLQANFRFCISDAVDISRYKADPDLMLDWEDVISVEMLSHAPIICPITLVDPFCPHITPCGHIFSFDAIMAHFIAQGGNELRASAACPLCATPIAARELRLVTVRRVCRFGPGDSVTMHLLQREKNSIIPSVVKVPPQILDLSVSMPSIAASDKSSVQKGDVSHQSPAHSQKPWPSPAGRIYAGAGVPGCPVTSQADVSPLQFAKFTTIADPVPLWVSVAESLSRKAVQLLAEGGAEATWELPPVLAAVESLANRAKSWSERRQRLFLERAVDEGVQEEFATPHGGLTASFSFAKEIEEAGTAARDAVRRAAENATIAMEAEMEKKKQASDLNESFPALSVVKTNHCAADAFTSNVSKLDEGGVPQPASTVVPPKLGPNPAPSTSTTGGEISKDDADLLYHYQSSDGQWLFLCPLNMKMLATHYGSFAACPATITMPILEIEDEIQTAVTRKRLRALSHLPLSGNFQVCEVDMSGMLPSEAIAPFAHELENRAKRRLQKQKMEARQRAREEKEKAAAAAIASTAPSAQELATMPLPSASLHTTAEAFAMGGQAITTDQDDAGRSQEHPDSPSAGVAIPGTSFATIARLGFAATGPALGDSPPAFGHSPTPGGAWAGQSPTTSGMWAPVPRGVVDAAASREGDGGDSQQPHAEDGQLTAALPPSVPRGKKSGGNKQKMLLLTSSHRRY